MLGVWNQSDNYDRSILLLKVGCSWSRFYASFVTLVNKWAFSYAQLINGCLFFVYKDPTG